MKQVRDTGKNHTFGGLDDLEKPEPGHLLSSTADSEVRFPFLARIPTAVTENETELASDVIMNTFIRQNTGSKNTQRQIYTTEKKYHKTT